jgi:predicted deacylase
MPWRSGTHNTWQADESVHSNGDYPIAEEGRRVVRLQDSPVRCTVDFDRNGKQVGRLEIPRSTNMSGWASFVVPVICIGNGAGPTALVMGGNHGDEYEGQIAALNLAREIDPSDIAGRLIIIPCLSMEASRNGTRLWSDGSNFNRSFPGNPNGSPNEQLADFLTRALFPRVDVVCDMHSGGRSMLFYPMSHMHVVADSVQRRAMLEGMLAWNTDYHMLYIDIAGSGLLPTEAENQGKIVVTTELGGGGHVTSRTLRITEGGLRNVLRHFSILSGEVQTRRSMGLPDAVILDATDPSNYIPAPESGIYETFVDPGDRVLAGQSVGKVHFLERPDRAPEPVIAPGEGIVCAIRALPLVTQGEVVATVGSPRAAEDLL